jgi:Uma2 family endonuclease
MLLLLELLDFHAKTQGTQRQMVSSIVRRMAMSLAELHDGKHTYADYLKWPDEERWELIDGEAWDMTPAPSTRHQRIVVRFSAILDAALAGRPCVVFTAPTDVVLSDNDVVQPDVLVVCDKKKITNANIQGAPDIIIEVMSSSTARKDRREKRALYEKTGVSEYILADPDGEYVERFILEGEGMFSKGEIFSPQEVLSLRALEGVEIPLWEVFEVKREEPHTENFS